MKIELEKLSPHDRYKLLAGFIVPRPIAFVSTCNSKGHNNLAPYSSFNYVGEDPPTIVLGLQNRKDGSLKDTTQNIRETGEFVINFVDESLIEQQNLCAIDFPPEIDESEITGIALQTSTIVKPNRIKQSPVAMECRRLVMLELGPERIICIGEVLVIHARDDLINPETYYVNEELYKPIGRIYGSLYVRLNDVFQLPRVLTYEDWKKMGDSPKPKPVKWE
ncbi:MAG: hypothetical protein CMF69_00165 [Magnetovibrio sp.]|nr:hypothetical protein [Magnetovibrio sp.]|tara:strand:- start:501 stop:1163 length:663 start_codon:yes stop_codon:yes gene_type:complete